MVLQGLQSRAAEGGDPSPLLSTGETSGVLGPVLGSPDGHGHTGTSSWRQPGWLGAGA